MDSLLDPILGGERPPQQFAAVMLLHGARDSEPWGVRILGVRDCIEDIERFAKAAHDALRAPVLVFPTNSWFSCKGTLEESRFAEVMEAKRRRQQALEKRMDAREGYKPPHLEPKIEEVTSDSDSDREDHEGHGDGEGEGGQDQRDQQDQRVGGSIEEAPELPETLRSVTQLWVVLLIEQELANIQSVFPSKDEARAFCENADPGFRQIVARMNADLCLNAVTRVPRMYRKETNAEVGMLAAPKNSAP